LMKTFGFSAGRIASAVRGIRAFDGDESTITMGPLAYPETGSRNVVAHWPVNQFFLFKVLSGQRRSGLEYTLLWRTVDTEATQVVVYA